MFNLNSLLIAGVLLAAMIASLEAGYRIGVKFQKQADEVSRSHINALQASLLGILALVLAFTLSLSLNRFDSRAQASVAEANAIGTAYLRAQLLPAPMRNEVLVAIRDYINLRVREGAISLNNENERAAVVSQTNQIQALLWRYARQAAEENPQPVPTGLFIQSVNDLIDANGINEAVLDRHVPEVVIWLMFGIFILTAGVIGFSVGIAGPRPSAITYILIVLIVLLMTVILDLDRPRRGLIQVSQKSMIDTQQMINSGTNP